jgi:hypothetical protein
MKLVKTIDVAGPGTLAAHNWLSANGRYSYVAFEGPGAGVAVVDHTTQTVVATYPYPGGGIPHGIQLDDPAALRPAVSVTARTVSRADGVPVSCSDTAAAFCRGTATLVAHGRGLGSAPFSLVAGKSELLHLPLRAGFDGHVVLSVTDGLGNAARLSWPLKVRP